MLIGLLLFVDLVTSKLVKLLKPRSSFCVPDVCPSVWCTECCQHSDNRGCTDDVCGVTRRGTIHTLKVALWINNQINTQAVDLRMVLSRKSGIALFNTWTEIRDPVIRNVAVNSARMPHSLVVQVPEPLGPLPLGVPGSGSKLLSSFASCSIAANISG